MKIRKCNWEKDYKTVIKKICYNSNSKITKKSYGFFSVMYFHSKDKVLCKILDDFGFYFAMKSKNKIRLIEIAIEDKHQKQGYGKILLFDLLYEMKKLNITKLEFRTPMNENAQYFWLKMGATIVDVKNDDYVMEINIE